MLTEAQQAKEMMRDLAALTGGVSLVDTNDPLAGIDRAVQVEQGLLTVNGTGKADNGTRRTFDLTLTPVQQQVLAGTGLRSVWAVDLPSGTHQLRVASVDTTTGRGGSVYLDVHVSDDVAQAAGALVASRFLSMMPTAFADSRLARWTTAMPTATRVFPAGDVLTVTVPHDQATQPTVHLTTDEGRVVWEGAGTPVDGVAAVQFVVPLDGIPSSVGELVIRTAHGAARATISIVGPSVAVKP